MAHRILWPNLPAEYRPIAQEAIGSGFETDFCATPAEVTDGQWANADAIVGNFPAQYIDKLRKCRIFVKYGVGYDDVDIERFGKLGIPVCNTPDYGTREVADHAIALMLTLSKSIAYHNSELHADLRGNWRPAHNPFGHRLSVCTFGVVGMGRIGTAAARRAQGLDMPVLFYDPYVPDGPELALGFERTRRLEELLERADVVSLHSPLTDETRHLIDAAALARMKPTAVVINTARGAIIDIDALHAALRGGRIAGAGIDVLPQEPPDPSHPLIEAFQKNEPWIAGRLLLTPHAAFYSEAGIRDLRRKPVETIVAYLTEGRLRNCVNADLLARYRPA